MVRERNKNSTKKKNWANPSMSTVFSKLFPFPQVTKFTKFRLKITNPVQT